MNLKNPFSWIVGIVILFGIWKFALPANEIGRINETLDRIEERFSFEKKMGTSLFAAAERISKIEELFFPKFEIEVRTYEYKRKISARRSEDLKGLVLAASQRLDFLEVKVVDREVSLEGESGKVHATVTASGRVRHANRDFLEVVEVQLVLQEDSGEWKLKTLRNVQVLE